MKMSCNGCRVLRKSCSENCSIRSCLAWIESPESQANATVFLAKFYGRTGLENLINTGPHHLRPAIFRSLLHEACGRIVNPIYGSVGLLWSGSWHLCQAAVDAVLNGKPITPIDTDTAAKGLGPSIKICDIRHISKEENTDENYSCNRKRYKSRLASLVSLEPEEKSKRGGEASHESSLNMWLEPVLSRANHVVVPVKKRRMAVLVEDTCKIRQDSLPF